MDTIIFISIFVGIIAGIIQIIQFFDRRGKRLFKRGEDGILLLANLQETKDKHPYSSNLLLSESQIIGTFYFTTEKIFARVHDKYELKLDPQSEEALAFAELNDRKKRGGEEGYYAATRFRVITFPEINESYVKLNMTPINYAFVALMKDESVPAVTKALVQAKINESAERLPKNLISKDQYFNSRSYNLLGMLTCLITADGLTLLRKRGKSVLTARNSWDVSVSGHPIPDDVVNSEVDLARTVRRETEYEIGCVTGDPRNIVFTGLHRNRTYGDIDIFAIWFIENTGDEIKELITEKNLKKDRQIFKTTKKVRESYVWDTSNLLVKFNGTKISKVFDNKGITFKDFTTESLVCLEVALRTQNQPSLAIGFI